MLFVPRAEVVADAFVKQMEQDGMALRAAKDGLEAAMSTGGALADATNALSAANSSYQAASLQVRKNCSQPKAKAKAKAKAAA